MITYEELLDHFWTGHDPTRPSWSRQYMSAIFYHSEEQRKKAEESKSAFMALRVQKIHKAILPADRFYPAEDYHQKYYLKNYPGLLREFEDIYPLPSNLVSSTAVARVNGYLGGHGSLERLRREVGDIRADRGRGEKAPRYSRRLGEEVFKPFRSGASVKKRPSV